MLDELHDQLRDVLDRDFEAVRLSSHLRRVDSSLEGERARQRELEEVLRREQRDIGRLEGRSLTALFRIVLGDREERLEKERQEFLAARLSLEQCEAAIEALLAEREELAEQLRALGDVERDLADVYRLRGDALERKGGRAGSLLTQLAEQTARVRGRGKEIREAIAAGEVALGSLLGTEQILLRNRNWGGIDVLGGGLMSTTVKYFRIDDAKPTAKVTQQHLNRFARELQNLAPGFDAVNPIDVSDLLTFADFFFDNLIVDYAVQSKSEASLARVREVTRKVESILARLAEELKGVEQDLSEAEAARRHLIERT